MTALNKQSVPADVASMDEDLKTILETQIGNLERRIESVIAHEETSSAKAKILHSIPGIGTVSAAMLIAEMPRLGQMTAGEVRAMTGVAPIRQCIDARQARDCRKTSGDAACAVPSRTCRHLSQSGSEADRIAAQNARQTVQARYRRLRAQTCPITNAIMKPGIP